MDAVAEDHLRHLPEFRLSPFKPFDTTLIELRNSKRNLITNILVQNTHERDRQRGKSQIVKENVRVVKNVRTVVVVVNVVPE